MLPVAEGVRDDRIPDTGPRAAIEDVDVRMGSHGLRVPKGRLDPTPLGGCFGSFAARSTDCHDLDAWYGPPSRKMGEGAPVCTHDPDSQCHCCYLGLPFRQVSRI